MGFGTDIQGQGCAPGFIAALMFALIAQPLAAQQGGPHCRPDALVVGTLPGADLVQPVARANPAMAQAAALLARVHDDQKPAARVALERRLRAGGRWNGDIFALLLTEAEAGVARAEAQSGTVGAIGGAIAGGIAGRAVGSLFGAEGAGGLAGAALTGQAGAAMMRNTLGTAVRIMLDEGVFGPVIDAMIAAPCRMTAQEALARLRA